VLAGDFDADGDVDGGDFVAWQSSFPLASGAARSEGDADGDGDVDGADFVAWQTNFPVSGPGATNAVPEPQGWFLATLGALMTGITAKSLRRRIFFFRALDKAVARYGL
jgi:hypothetical protein